MSKKNSYSTEPISGSRDEETQMQAETVQEKPATPATPDSVAVTVDDQSIPEEKPVAKAPEKPATPVATPTATPKANPDAVRVVKKNNEQPANRRVQTFEYLVEQYVKLSKINIPTEAGLKQKLYQFANIIRMIINSTDTAVYDAAYQFFKEYRNSILSEDLVFGYIHDIPTEQSIRMQTIYTTFRALVEANLTKTKFALDYGLIRDNLKLPVQHPLLNWIRKKLHN